MEGEAELGPGEGVAQTLEKRRTKCVNSLPEKYFLDKHRTDFLSDIFHCYKQAHRAYIDLIFFFIDWRD